MKNQNGYLSLGLVIVIFFITMMTFPSLFTDHSPYDITGVQSIQNEDGSYSFLTPPFEPGDQFVWGSDDSGRDVSSFVVYGARLTLTIGIVVALLRFVLGLLFGITSSLENGFSTVLVDQFNHVFNAIPPLIICLIVLSIGFLGDLPKVYSVIVFITVMTIVEWARVAVLVRERSLDILKKDFIRSEQVIGKSNLRIVFEHVLPHMFSELVVLFFMEISRVLTLMMQLGLFGIFVGNLKIVEDTGAGVIVGKKTSYEPEWASMLGSSKNYVRVAPWIVFSCAIAFFLSVLGFNFTGEGFRMLYQDGKRLFKNKRQQILVLLLVVGVMVVGFIGTFSPSLAVSEVDRVEFNDLPSTCLMGTEAAETVSQDILSQLKELGLEGVKGQYAFPYDSENYYHVTDFDVRLKNGQELIKDDFALLSYGPFQGEGKVVDLRDQALVSVDFENNDFKARVDNRFVIMNGDVLDSDGYLFFGEKLIEETGCLGVIIPVDQVEQKWVGTRNFDAPILTIKRERCEALVDQNLSVAIKATQNRGQGMNIVGQIISPEATDESKGVILGFSYNYLDERLGQKQLEFALNLISQLKANESQLKRNITVVFWDGTYDEALTGLNSYRHEYYYPVKHTLLYMDMTSLYTLENRESPIVYDDAYVTLTKPDAYSMVSYFKNTLGPMGQTDLKLGSAYSVFYHKRGIQTLYIGSNGSNLNQDQVAKLQKALVETLLKEIY